MNNMNFDGFSYPDMNLINNLFFQDKNQINMDNSISNNIDKNNLYQPYDGYIRGNIYKDLYSQYKNYQPQKLIPNNEQAELLLNVDQITFFLHEIRLYLDVYPNDSKMIKLFNDYQKMAEDSIKAYEIKYGPICSSSKSSLNNYSWESYNWPWEMEEL